MARLDRIEQLAWDLYQGPNTVCAAVATDFRSGDPAVCGVPRRDHWPCDRGCAVIEADQHRDKDGVPLLHCANRNLAPHRFRADAELETFADLIRAKLAEESSA